MADPRLPEEMDRYMDAKGWSKHHEKWHLEQRHDFYHHLAKDADPVRQDRGRRALARMKLLEAGRSPFQEGTPGHGLHFLAMHRAMFLVLAEAFPQHVHYLEGWRSIPQDPDDADDPVPARTRPEDRPFDPHKAEAIARIERDPESFASEDEFALFLETNMRPTAADPAAVSSDRRTGLHNYLHNRWSDRSEVNLGDSSVNHKNGRFWRMHGWIDRMWTDFRRARGLSDEDPAYVALIAHHREMMSNPPGHHHHMMPGHGGGPGSAAEAAARETSEAAAGPLADFFEDGS